MKKFVAVLAAVVVMGSAAAGLQVTGVSDGRTLQPGVNQSVANFTVTGGVNESIQGFTDNANFDTYYNITGHVTGNTSQEWRVDVGGSVPATFPAGTYTSTVFVTGNVDSGSVDAGYTVAADRGWQVSSVSTTDTVSVGSSGQYGNFSVESRGNADVELSFETKGNISEYVSVADLDNVKALTGGGSVDVNLRFDVPPDTGFGYYAGNVTVTGAGNRSVVNVSAVFEDRIAPNVRSVVAPDVMATLTGDMSVEAADNLGITFVDGTVYREVEAGNETVNSTVKSFNFTQGQGDTWSYTYGRTAEKGRYWLEVSARDASGNVVNAYDRFFVDRLDVTEVLEDNFNIGAMRTGEEVDRDLIRNAEQSPFTVTLTEFEYFGNSTVDVGVLPPDASSPEFFDDDDRDLKFTEPGTYKLVVSSRGEEGREGVFEYRGEMNVSVPSQHVGVPRIVFDGSVNSQTYPEPEFLTAGSFQAHIGYQNAVDTFIDRYGEPTTEQIVFIGVADREQCRQAETFAQCASGIAEFSGLHNKTAQQEDRIGTLETTVWNRTWQLGGAAGLGWLLVMYLVFLNREAMYFPVKDRRMPGGNE